MLQRSPKKEKSRQQSVDFTKVNKIIAAGKASNASELKKDEKFRIHKRPIGAIKAHILDDVNIQKIGSKVYERAPAFMKTFQSNATTTHKRAQSTTFGRANRPSTPIQGVISNTYANIAESDLMHKYEVVQQQNEEFRKKKELKNTRARELAVQYIMNSTRSKFAESQNPTENFKMKRFANVQSRVTPALQ